MDHAAGQRFGATFYFEQAHNKPYGCYYVVIPSATHNFPARLTFPEKAKYMLGEGAHGKVLRAREGPYALKLVYMFICNLAGYGYGAQRSAAGRAVLKRRYVQAADQYAAARIHSKAKVYNEYCRLCQYMDSSTQPQYVEWRSDRPKFGYHKRSRSFGVISGAAILSEAYLNYQSLGSLTHNSAWLKSLTLSSLPQLMWLILDSVQACAKKLRPYAHRDYNEYNLLLSSDFNRVVVIDFGSARKLGHHAGRFSYGFWCPPEAVLGAGAGSKQYVVSEGHDVYVIGLALFNFCVRYLSEHCDDRQSVLRCLYALYSVKHYQALIQEVVLLHRFAQNHLQPEADRELFCEILSVLSCCLAEKPEERPSLLHLIVAAECWSSQMPELPAGAAARANAAGAFNWADVSDDESDLDDVEGAATAAP